MTVITPRVLLALVALLCVGSNGASSANAFAFQDTEATVLAWKLEKDDQLELEFTQTQDLLTRIDARDRTLESALALGVSWQVLSVAGNGDATIEQTIDRIRVRTGTPGAVVKKVVDLDTDSKEALRGVSRDVMKQIRTLIGLKFTVVMSPNGKIVSLTPGANVAGVVGGLPETSALRRIFDTEAMTQLISGSTFVMPDKAVKTDATWTDKTELKMKANDGRSFTFDRTVNSEVVSIDQKQANIDVEIELSQQQTAATKPKSALTSPLELTAFSGGGSFVFDHSTGNIVSSTIATQTETRVIYREDQVKTTINITNELSVTRK